MTASKWSRTERNIGAATDSVQPAQQPPGQHADECSFDAIIRKYGLEDLALKKLVLIVRGADMAARHLAPESARLEVTAEGFRLVYSDDHIQLEREMALAAVRLRSEQIELMFMLCI